MARLGEEGLEALKPGIVAIGEASEGTAQAQKVFTVGKDLYDRGIVGEAVRAAFNSMGFWEKLFAGASVFLTVGSWFVSGGAALVLELVNAGIAFASLVTDSIA